MSVLETVLIAVGLSMDAFAVSVCKGLAMKTLSLKKMLIVGLWFGAFQALMPLLGYLLGSAFGGYITAIDHWIAFVLLAIVGGKMLKESFEEGERESNDSIKPAMMFTLAVATSIDAFAVGITFALLPSVNILLSVGQIGLITLLLSALGVMVGHRFGKGQNERAERLGGVILICMGLKILMEHLGFLTL